MISFNLWIRACDPRWVQGLGFWSVRKVEFRVVGIESVSG